MKKPVTKAEKALAFGKAAQHCNAIIDLLEALDKCSSTASDAISDLIEIIEKGINEISPLGKPTIFSTKGEQ